MLIALPLALCGCNQEDDVFEIFSSGQWRVNNYYTDCNTNREMPYLKLLMT